MYKEKFITLDNEFYSRFALADNVFFRSWGFYFLNLDDVLVKRKQLIENKIQKIKQNKNC